MVLTRKNVGNEKDEWQTPPWLFDLLDKEYDFEIDVACTLENCLCQTGFTVEQNALVQDWRNAKIYMNPPYSGGQIGKFMKKAYDQSMKYHDAVIVCLIPVASDTRWWHRYVMMAQEIRFIEGRVDYVGYDEQGNQIKQSPTFPSCVVKFHADADAFMIAYGWNTPKIGQTIKNPKKVKYHAGS